MSEEKAAAEPFVTPPVRAVGAPPPPTDEDLRRELTPPTGVARTTGPVPVAPEPPASGSKVRSRLVRFGSRTPVVSPALEPLLVAVRANHPKADLSVLERAYATAERAHRGQMRRSGDPYITHPVAVATILADLGMTPPTLAAALLHDTVEDTDLTLDEIRREFGDEVGLLVDGVTKLAQLPRVSKDGNQPIDRHVESLRKTFMAMSEDVRVVLIKLADRLHNMRTLGYKQPEKQKRIARETLEIFAPLANRLGIWRIKSELEDLSFQYLEPERWRELSA